MAPPRKHETDVILDAARTLVLQDGPRAVSIAAIAAASGAPVGTLYHRFGNRTGVLTAAWIRALDRFQRGALANSGGADAIEAAVGMALASITFARKFPDDARLLLLSPQHLVDGEPPASFAEKRARMNVPIVERVQHITRALHGTDEPRELDSVIRATAALPYAAIRWHARDGQLPTWLEDDIAASVRALLTPAPS